MKYCRLFPQLLVFAILLNPSSVHSDVMSEQAVRITLGLGMEPCSKMLELVPALSGDFSALEAHSQWALGYWTGLNVEAMLDQRPTRDVSEVASNGSAMNGQIVSGCLTTPTANLLQVSTFLFERLPESD